MSTTAKAPTGPLHVTKLTVRNYKRIDFAEISPEASIVMLRGPNGAGKSSIDECMIAALSGKGSDVAVPIRSGQREAETVLELGDKALAAQYVVTVRHWLPDGETDPGTIKRSLKVDRRLVDGTYGPHPGGPQTFLTAMLASVTHSPTELVRGAATAEGARRLARSVMEACGLSDEYDAAFDAGKVLRSEIHAGQSKIEYLKHDLAALPDDVAALMNSADGSPFDASGQQAKCDDELAKYGAARTAVIESQARARLATDSIADAESRTTKLEADIKLAEESIERMRYEIDDQTKRIQEARRTIDAMSEATGDIGWYDGAIAAETARRYAIGAAAAAAEKRRELTAAEEAVQGLKARLGDLPSQMTRIFARTGIDEHVAGAALDEDGMIVVNGRPATMLSTGEAIQLVVAIATITRPTIRVMWIDEADCLDADTLRAIERIAEERGYQIWMTAVYATAGEVHDILDGKIVRRELAKSEGDR